MPSLKTLTGIAEEEIELLEAAGYLETAHLQKVDAGTLLEELEKANEVLDIVETLPSQRKVESWIRKANTKGKGSGSRKASGAEPKADTKKVKTSAPKGKAELSEPEISSEEKSEEGVSAAEAEKEEAGVMNELEESSLVVEEEVTKPSEPQWVNHEAVEEVREMIERSPLAIPLPVAQLAQQGIAPSAIAVAPVLNRAAGDLEIRATAARSYRSEPAKPRAAASPRSSRRTADAPPEKRGIDVSRVRSMEEADESEVAQPLPRGQVDERVKLLTTARESTNKGKKRDSRRFIRGVLHDRPILVWMGSVIVLLLVTDIPLALISAVLLMISSQNSEAMAWVPQWLLVFPLILPVLGLLYLTVAIRVKCRVCGQRLFVPRHCLKHVKAHHVPGLGHMIPTAIQIILFCWFHCIFCGTAVRIKE
ncbi:hypothetical protein HNR46_002280 [Haloferula luteola]|uniref:DUF4332 domain-containing protein n=1 Tax=Haloferula luteola TaxID=595692 RepID=A0A840VDX9_9BACT|nr:DUF4332 domain-containing protein [Haloferula luteola]MBB5352039.1 hypothetical protein [Haloferula luteola]